MRSSIELLKTVFREASLLVFILGLTFGGSANLLAQPTEGPTTINPPAKPKVSVYDREALSFLIDAPEGVELEVLGSADLIRWERIAGLEGNGKPIIWAAPKSLAGPNHFFRIRTAGGVVPLGGPDEKNDSGDEDEHNEGPGDEHPEPNDPTIAEPFPDGPFGQDIEVIDPKSELANELAEAVLAELGQHDLELIEVVHADSLDLGEEGTQNYIKLRAKNKMADELMAFGWFLEKENGVRQLQRVDLVGIVDLDSELAKQLAEQVLRHVDDASLKLDRIVVIEHSLNENEGLYFVHLLATSDEKKEPVEVIGEAEVGLDDSIKVIHAECLDLLEPIGPIDPDDPNWGDITVEPIDPESDLGKKLLEIAMTELEAEGFTLQDVIGLEQITEEGHEYFGAILQCASEDGEELIVFVEMEQDADGNLKVHQIDFNDGTIGPEPIPGGGGGVIDPGNGGELKTEELDVESDLVKTLIDLVLSSDQAKGFKLEEVVGALKLTFGDEPSIYLIDFLVKGEDGKIEKAFADITESDDGFEEPHVQIGEVGIGPGPMPEPQPDGRILPPEGVKKFYYDDPRGDFASALVTIVHLTIADHVGTPWEIENVEELLQWHEPNHGSRFALLAKGAAANGKSDSLLAVLKRAEGSLTIELDEVRVGIDPEKPIQLPLPPEEDE